ncbi:hypothetical protein OIU76_014712 [Salix suchowensis]|nr:hypothetical protein OIU76_014712 [Salix suchowensis]
MLLSLKLGAKRQVVRPMFDGIRVEHVGSDHLAKAAKSPATKPKLFDSINVMSRKGPALLMLIDFGFLPAAIDYEITRYMMLRAVIRSGNGDDDVGYDSSNEK